MSADHAHASQGTHRSKLTIAVDPATWPDLVEAGRQAGADLVVTALPMVGNKVRANRRRDDQGSELSIALLQAAYRFGRSLT